MAKDKIGTEEKRPKKKLKRFYNEQDQQLSPASAQEEGRIGLQLHDVSDSLPQDPTHGGSQE